MDRSPFPVAHPIYQQPIIHDTGSILDRIQDLCRIAVAASSSEMNVEIDPGTLSSLFEIIAEKAVEAQAKLTEERRAG